MSVRDQILTALQQVRSEIARLTDKVDELEARLASVEDFEIVSSIGTTAPSRTESSVPSERERIDAAIQTGEFFRRALTGLPRGEFGRNRIKLQSRIYVVVKEFNGTTHTDPVLVFSQFSRVKAIVAEGGQGNQFGDSIFAGFASAWEARRAVATAGYSWPATHS